MSDSTGGIEVSQHEKIHQVGEFIKTVGSPVLAFLMMFYVVVVSLKELTVAVSQNTMVIQRLIDRLDSPLGNAKNR